MRSARPKLEITTVAPCSCATRAAAKPIEASVVTPATRMRLPSRMPMGFSLWCGDLLGMGMRSVAHAEAAVDRDHGPGDVRRGVAGQPGDRAGDLGGAGV